MGNINTLEDSRAFYESRYRRGYMEGWPREKIRRVFELIRALNLPSEGKALDFGCGNGVFTRVLKQALPNWTVYGFDLSETAIENARSRVPDCVFFSPRDGTIQDEKFDFVISHHVLEHVHDIEDVAKQIGDKLKSRSSMLHILPCGNEGSFEWRLCQLRSDGIDQRREGRFFYEDEGHVRRMTTDSCSALFRKHGFVLERSFYANQHHGAVNYITRSHPELLLKMFNPFKGKDLAARLKLCVMLAKFGILTTSRLPFILHQKRRAGRFTPALYLPSRVSMLANEYFVSMAEREWNESNTRSNGSEMYLYFVRGAPSP